MKRSLAGLRLWLARLERYGRQSRNLERTAWLVLICALVLLFALAIADYNRILLDLAGKKCSEVHEHVDVDDDTGRDDREGIDRREPHKDG